MNTRSFIATGMVCATALTVSVVMSNAGPLNPPAGPVAPTHKTLTEVEPRVAINATNTPGDADSLFKITQPGSYCLTGNITGVAGKHGIEIASAGVTLDLTGFDLQGVAGSLNGVFASVASAANVHIRNGSIRNWDGAGVDAINARNSSLRDLLAANNGLDGLLVGLGDIVEGCAAENNGGDGISANFGATVTGNTARSNGGDGISANGASIIRENASTFNSGAGIVAGFRNLVVRNNASFNRGDGIQVSNDSLVLENVCNINGNGGDGAGVHATSIDNRIEGNAVGDNDRGIDVDFAGNFIIRNSASGNTINYDIVADNKVGVIVNAPNSGAIIGATGGAGVGTTNPWANFSF